MPIDVQMPDGTIISGVPDNVTQSDLLKRYQAYTPPAPAKNLTGAVPDELGRYDAAKQPAGGPPVVNPEGGFSGALAGSTQQIQADITRLAGKIGLKDTAQAEREAKQYEAEARRVFKPTEKGWTEAPLTKLAETAGGSLPYMAAPIAAGVAALALPEIGLAGGLIGTAELAAGAVGVGQFTGSNLSRQVQEGKTLEEASLLKAGAAAIPQAALDVFGLKMLPGIRQIFNKAGVEVTEQALQEVAKKGLLEQAGYYSLQTGKVMGAEGLTEAGQQVFERLQAGLNIADEQARKEYYENFVGGALLGGAFSVPGHAYEAISGKTKKEAEKESKDGLAEGMEKERESLLEEGQRYRYQELDTKANGTPDKVVTDENGNEQVIKGEKKQYLTFEEQKEYQVLRDKFETTKETQVEQNVSEKEQKQENVAQNEQINEENIRGGQDIKYMQDELGGKDITQQEEKEVEKEIEKEAEKEGTTVEQIEKEEVEKEADKEPVNEEVVKEVEKEVKENPSFTINKTKEEIHNEIKDFKDGKQAGDWLVGNAPNSAAEHIAQRVLDTVKKLEKAGIPVRFRIQTGPIKGSYKTMGDKTNQATNVLAWAGPRYGVTSTGKNIISHYQVSLNGLNKSGAAHRLTGTDYSTILHEMLHVVTSAQLHAMKQGKFKGDKSIYKNLLSIKRAIADKYAEEEKLPPEQRNPKLRTFMHYMHWSSIGRDGKPNFKEGMPDELISHGLTDHDFQAWLSTIKMGKSTALQELMKIFRKLLGIDPNFETALDRLVSTTNKFFDMTAEQSNRFTEGYGVKFGPGFGKISEIEDHAALPNTGGEARNYKGQPVEAAWSFPEDSIKHWHGLSDEKVDNIIYKLQDKQIDTKRAQQIIEKEVGKIDDDLNVYDKEQLYHGRTATGIREFLLNELMPAIKELQKLGLSPQEMREYLHNRHAEERNNKMNEINKNDPVTGEARKEPWALQDRASGISTADAKAYLAGLDAKKKAALEKVGNMFDKMVKETQDILVASGAETQATVDAWNSTYEHYVPLFRVEEDIGGFGTTGASKGFGTRGAFSKRALGSEKEVQDILGNLIAQRERALIRAEKIKVGRALYALALKNPNPDLWLPVNPDAIKSKEALIAELHSLGFENANEIANNLMEEPKSRYISKTNKIDPNTGLPLSDTEESVRLKIDNLARFGDNVFPVRINGKDRYIFFNQNNPTAVRMVHSLKNLDADSLGQIEGIIGKMTRWFAAVNTQYNPIFGAVNLIRDVGGAMFNLSTTPIAGMQTKVSAGIFPAMRGIINVLRDERKGKTDTTGKWAKAFQEFRKEGGQTGYRDSLIRTDEEMAIVEKQMGKIKDNNVKKAFGAVMGALTDFNDMMENSVRVSAYIAAKEKGLSKQQAAIVAKNLTVNFDKKGQLSARINAYYAFFNASMQGTARLAQTLKGPMGRKIIAGGIGLGTMQAIMMAAAGYREDEPPEFIKERNFVIPMPNGKYISIPYPLGLHILPNIGRITTEFVLNGGKHGGKKVANMTGAFMDAFSPVGSSGLSIQSVLPTVLDPIAALESNKDAFGRPIYREDRATNPMPGYMRSRESASEISKNVSYFLNLASGGGKYSKGFLSPTADELDYIAGQITGGVGRELIKTEQAIKAGVTGEELPTYRIPLAGRFIGDTDSKAAESQRFYSNITRMADHEHEVKGRQKNKENVMEYYRDHPEARFWQMANNVENQINAINKQKKEFQEKGFPKERIQRIDNQKAVIMKRFNDHIAKYEE